MVITPTGGVDGGGDGGGGHTGGGDIRCPLSEHSHKFYCDEAHYGPVYGGGADHGARVSNWWWDQECLELEGILTAAWVAELEM